MYLCTIILFKWNLNADSSCGQPYLSCLGAWSGTRMTTRMGWPQGKRTFFRLLLSQHSTKEAYVGLYGLGGGGCKAADSITVPLLGPVLPLGGHPSPIQFCPFPPKRPCGWLKLPPGCSVRCLPIAGSALVFCVFLGFQCFYYICHYYLDVQPYVFWFLAAEGTSP